MDRLDDLKTRIERVIAEFEDITQLLERNIADSEKAVSFGQVKEIEAFIVRLKKQGLPVPTELTELKIALFSRYEQHQEQIALCKQLQQSIRGFIKQETSRMPKRTQISEPDADHSSGRRPSNYEKPLGSKGYSNLEDYLIPVIKLMWSGLAHKEAFRKIAQKLDVRYNTVSSQCTRALDLTTDEFIRQVNSKSIVDLLERKYPDQYRRIKAELKP
ncbi:MAG: hypothetical protein E4H23_08045 [Chrysiogenales bacterium]|nr:MAG: hypothetical protein E4H23_08045 [Chrysiogenales bacterium]